MQALGLTWRNLAIKLKKSIAVSKSRELVKVAFSEKYLLYTNVTISVSLSAVGDSLEQAYEIFTGDADKFDTKRTFHMGCSGFAVGILCHNWYKVLDKYIVGRSVDMVLKKLTVDQFIFSPIMIVTFFGSVALFEKEPLENFKTEVKDKFMKLYQAEWVIWPPAQIINFYYLPTRYRVLYDNVISLGYDVYTSHVKHGKSMKSIGKDAISVKTM